MHNVSDGGFRVAFFTVSVSSSFWSDRGFLNDGSLYYFWGFDNFCVVLIMCDNLDIDFYINQNWMNFMNNIFELSFLWNSFSSYLGLQKGGAIVVCL